MKEYHVHRLDACPTGEHVDPETDATVDCTCPALTVKASGPPGPTEPHLMQWSRGELARLVREFDRGYFDHEKAPARTTSMFISDWQQQLLDAVRDDPLRAVTMLLARMRFDMLSYNPVDSVLSFRLLPGQYVHMLLPTDHEKGLEVRRLSSPAGGDVLWQRDRLESLSPWVEDDVRGQVRKLLEPRGWSPADTTVNPLVDDTMAEDERLALLEQVAAQLDMPPLDQLPGQASMRELVGQMGIDEALVMGAVDKVAAQMTGELRAAGLLPEGHQVVYDSTPFAAEPAAAQPATPARARKSKRKRTAPRLPGEDGAPIP